MIVVLVVILTILFALGSISELIVTDDVQDLVMLEQP